MATYECAVCGMAVNATCAKCDAPLVDDILKLDDGMELQDRLTIHPDIKVADGKLKCELSPRSGSIFTIRQ